MLLNQHADLYRELRRKPDVRIEGLGADEIVAWSRAYLMVADVTKEVAVRFETSVAAAAILRVISDNRLKEDFLDDLWIASVSVHPHGHADRGRPRRMCRCTRLRENIARLDGSLPSSGTVCKHFDMQD